MKASLVAISLVSTVLTGCVTVDAQDRPRAMTTMDAAMAAIANPLRPAADRARDVARKPMETVVFAGVRPGDTVAELAPGGGWYTRILAGTVGPTGRIYALVSPQQAARPGGLDAINALAAQYGNITVVPTDYTAIAIPTPADVVWTTENWHDFHNGPTANPTGIAKAAYAALKPGGLLFIEDHSAPGTGTSATQTLHRIDAAAVIAEATAAGFKLDAQSSHMANTADDHTAAVRDAGVQGHTDKFALRFKKR
ncbi:MAG: methyltransferase [Croceibacterium sp.]